MCSSDETVRPRAVNGVIDVGSTSVRLALTDGRTVRKTLFTTRLAEGAGRNGELSVPSMERTVRAVSECRRAAEAAGAERVFCFATAAVRDAGNARTFLRMIKEECGLDADVLSGKREAELGFAGACGEGVCCVADTGGASTEITVGSADGIIYSGSVRAGIVALTDAAKRGEDAEGIVEERLSELGEVPPFDRVIGTGGTITTVAAMLLELETYDPAAVDGREITLAELEALYERIRPMSPAERKLLPGLPERRADLIDSGILVYARLLRRLGADRLTVSEGDCAEGYLMEKGILPAGFRAEYGGMKE